MSSPTGDQFSIAAGDFRATVTETGVLRELTHAGRPLVEGIAEDAIPDGGRGQLLVPWPNRLRDGRYTFGGRTHQLALTEPSRHNASHGLVRWVSWTVAVRAASRIELTYRLPAQSGYPWSLDLRTTYELGEDGLTVTQEATNLATSAAPYAAGAHPYLVAGDGRCDEWSIEQPAGTVLTTDEERLLPAGRRPVAEIGLVQGVEVPVGDLVLNHAVTDLLRAEDGTAALRLRAADGKGVELWVDGTHPWLQLYTGEDTVNPRASIAVEPMTAPPDAFNSGDDLVVLEPGAQHRAVWGIRSC